jgi:hypothetical protein
MADAKPKKRDMNKYQPNSLPAITSVEVVSLRGRYPKRMDYMLDTTGARSVMQEGAPAQRIAELWRSLPPGEQMRCHTPPYGLRFFRDGELLCQASLCWECNNLFGDVQGDDISYVFDAKHPVSQDLLVVLKSVMGDLGIES